MLKKPLKKKEKIVVKQVRRHKGNLAINANNLYNTIRTLNRMNGGMSKDLIDKITTFLIKKAEIVLKLKYKLIDKLCEHIIKKEGDENYKQGLKTLKNIYSSFSSSDEVYKYNITDFKHDDTDIKNLVYTLKLIKSISSGLNKEKKTDLNGKISAQVFNQAYVPEELLTAVNKDDFVQIYKGRITESLPPSPQPLPPPSRPVKETIEEARKSLLDAALILSRKIVVSQDKTEPTHLTPIREPSYSLEKRIEKYNKINKLLNKIKYHTCLNNKTNDRNIKYTIGDNVKLTKKIGNGASGDIYQTTVENTDTKEVEHIVSKVMEPITDNKNETIINDWITENIILKKQSKHFALTYKSTECIKIGDQLTPNEKLVNYIEQCDGDLHNFIMNGIDNVLYDTELMINIAIQELIAIGTYQDRIGFCHNDAHSGNFLYQKNSDIGYYQYKYNDTIFYIKSCKYNIFIYDFGKSIPIDIANDYMIIDDYSKVLRVANYKGGAGAIDDINAKVEDIKKIIMSGTNTLNGKNIFKKIFEDVITVFGEKHNIFTTTKPDNIINEIPYIINKTVKYLNIYIDNSLVQRNVRRLKYINKSAVFQNIKNQKQIIKKDDVIIYKIQVKYLNIFEEHIYPIAMKVMDINSKNIREILINNAIMKILILNEKSKHFIIEYNQIFSTDALKFVCDRKIVKYMELCECYLTTILFNKDIIKDEDLMINILFQAFICIATYHANIGLCFSNITSENFLVQTNDQSGYYNYMYNDKNFYIKSCKYNIIINDFRNCVLINDDNDSHRDIYNNYKNILDFLIKKATDKAKEKLENIQKELQKIVLSENYFVEIIDKIFNSENTIFTYDNPDETIINDADKKYIIKSQNTEDEQNKKDILVQNQLKLDLNTENVSTIEDAYMSIGQSIQGIVDIEEAVKNTIEAYINSNKEELKEELTEELKEELKDVLNDHISLSLLIIKKSEKDTIDAYKKINNEEVNSEKTTNEKQIAINALKTANSTLDKKIKTNITNLNSLSFAKIIIDYAKKKLEDIYFKYTRLISTIDKEITSLEQIDDVVKIMKDNVPNYKFKSNNLILLNEKINIYNEKVKKVDKEYKTYNDLIETINKKIITLVEAILKKKQIKNFEDDIKESYDIIEKEVAGKIKLSVNLSGGNPPKYKSTGEAVYILYKKKKYKRTIYVKDKRKTKYCKINNEYILLSKLKVLQGTLM